MNQPLFELFVTVTPTTPLRFFEHRSIKLFNSRSIRRSIDKIRRKQEEAALLKGGQSSAEILPMSIVYGIDGPTGGKDCMYF